MAKKTTDKLEKPLEAIERTAEQPAEVVEEPKPEIEPDVPIIIETSKRTDAHERVIELKTKAASMGLCKMESTPIQFIKQDYLDPGHFSVKLIFSK